MPVRVPERFQLNREPRRQLIEAVTAGTSIPKVIHQTFHTTPLSRAFMDNVDRIKAINPGWTHRFYDEDARCRFIGASYGAGVLSRYQSISTDYGAARADLFRYLLLYKEGGLYLDMKSSTDRSLDDVIRPDDVYLLSNWGNRAEGGFTGWGMHREVRGLRFGELQQWFIASAPGHPFLKRVIEFVLRNISVYMHNLHSYGSFAVLRVTGPVPYSVAIDPLLDRCRYRLVDSQKDLGLLYSIFEDSRAHLSIAPHYSKLKTPLILVDRRRQLFDSMLGVAKRGALLVRPKAAPARGSSAESNSMNGNNQ